MTNEFKLEINVYLDFSVLLELYHDSSQLAQNNYSYNTTIYSMPLHDLRVWVILTNNNDLFAMHKGKRR